MSIMLQIVVALQVLVFQFVAPRWSSVLPRYLVGTADLTDDAAADVRAWTRRARRMRQASGFLLLVAIAIATLAGADAAWGKPLLAAVSIASALLFLTGYVRDRVRLRALSSRAPTPSTRMAALEPRTLGDAYRPAWESVPIAVTALTLAATLWALVRDGGAGLFLVPGLQLAVAGGGLLLSLEYARRSPELPQRVRSALGDPATAFAISARARTLELRALLGAKAGVVLFLALLQAGKVLSALGSGPAPVLESLEWSVVVGLLGGFAAYLRAMTALGRES